ncbi:MAG: MaoC/PaaZ C-terminal domain-containing protein [Halioglobus sp.]|nr:MaoC/PaaZ C-terminal domain-containing protein [Halioglobus sp.]
MKSLGSFSISAQESQAFARFSGDFNPLHLSPVAARRTQFGQTLIHGVFGTLRALDLWLAHTDDSHCALARLKVKYSRPASQGMKLSVSADTSGDAIRLEVFASGVRCQIIEFEVSRDQAHAAAQPIDPLGSACIENSVTCRDTTIADCMELADTVELFWNNELAASLLPNASKLLPQSQLATIVASTQIVGMKCPGLHSIFAQLQLKFLPANTDAISRQNTHLNYEVLKADARIDQVQLTLSNAYCHGTLEAFFRARPAQQARFEAIAELVSQDEFSNQNALIIGGSRGLGEVITKVLAAGGANVMMTYAAGKDDAFNVSAEIAEHRPAPPVCQLDVLEGAISHHTEEFCAAVSHIYYLASPIIARGDSNRWDENLFSKYCDYYVNGLAQLLHQVRQFSSHETPIQLFIPSSIFLDDSTTAAKGFDEYIAAKSAAEAYVRRFENTHSNWSVVAPRLPRLHTDQTSGIKNINEQSTLEVIIEQLKKEFGQTGKVKPNG